MLTHTSVSAFNILFCFVSPKFLWGLFSLFYFLALVIFKTEDQDENYHGLLKIILSNKNISNPHILNVNIYDIIHK